MLLLCLVSATYAVSGSPVPTITSPDGLTFKVNTAMVPISIAFSEPVTTLSRKDVLTSVIGEAGVSVALKDFEAVPKSTTHYTANLDLSGIPADTNAAVYVTVPRDSASSIASKAPCTKAMLVLNFVGAVGKVALANEMTSTGYTNRENVDVLVSFGQEVADFVEGDVRVSALQGLRYAGPASITAIDVDKGDYRLTLNGFEGEGDFTLNLLPVTAKDGKQIEGSTLECTRDTTPPTLEITCDRGELQKVEDFQTDSEDYVVVVKDVEFVTQEVFSEDVVDFSAKDLKFQTAGLGGAVMAPVVEESPLKYSATITSITTSPKKRSESDIPDNMLKLTVWVVPESVEDLAGNLGPQEGASNQLVVVADLTDIVPHIKPETTSAAAEQEEEGISMITIVLFIFAAILGLLLIGAIYYIVKKRAGRQNVTYRAIDNELAGEEFGEYADLVFDNYRGPVTDPNEKDVVTYQQVVQFTVDKGYPLDVSQNAAKQLIEQASSVPRGQYVDRLYRQEWHFWLREKISKGKEPTSRDVRELKVVFSV